MVKEKLSFKKKYKKTWYGSIFFTPNVKNKIEKVQKLFRSCPVKCKSWHSIIIFGITAIFLISSTECEVATEEGRHLKRRVQMGRMEAPPLQLPRNGGTIDLGYMANLQLYSVLSKTNTFSTANVDPSRTWNLDGLDPDVTNNFRRCEDEPQEFMNPLTQSFQKSTFSQVAACLLDMPHGRISGGIIDFNLVNRGGVGLSLGKIPFFPGFNFSFSKMELTLLLNTFHPLQRGGIRPGDRRIIATTERKKYQRSYSVNFNLNFSGATATPEWYYQTPLRKVIDDALSDGLKDLRRIWDGAEPWYAMVLRSCDKYIFIGAGNKTDSGLLQGDIVRIQNVHYRWSGPVCRSELLGSMDYVGGAFAYAQVVSVGDTVSAARILENDPVFPRDPDQIIYPGARVYVHKLIEDPNQKDRKNPKNKR